MGGRGRACAKMRTRVRGHVKGCTRTHVARPCARAFARPCRAFASHLHALDGALPSRTRARPRSTAPSRPVSTRRRCAAFSLEALVAELGPRDGEGEVLRGRQPSLPSAPPLSSSRRQGLRRGRSPFPRPPRPTLSPSDYAPFDLLHPSPPHSLMSITPPPPPFLLNDPSASIRWESRLDGKG